MKYAIVYLLKGEAQKYHKKLVRELALKFNEPYILDNPIPSHVTLKYPFKTDKINEIDKLLSEFVRDNKSSKARIRKIDNFHKKIVFLKVEFSKFAINNIRKLMKELKTITWLDWGEFDEKEKFHATLVYGNTPESFNKIWKYVFEIKPKFNLELDNITILKKPRKYWKIHKVYKLK
jgi:2'-5' RNA ligase